jgi:hypothetical protein
MKEKTTKEKAHFILKLRYNPARVDQRIGFERGSIGSLRRVLKALVRRYGFECVGLSQISDRKV